MRKAFRHGNSLVVRTPCFHYSGPGSIPGWGTKIPHASGCGQKKEGKKKKRYDHGISFSGITFTLPGRFFYSCNSLYTGNEKDAWEEMTRESFRARESTLHKRLPAAGCACESLGLDLHASSACKPFW